MYKTQSLGRVVSHTTALISFILGNCFRNKRPIYLYTGTTFNGYIQQWSDEYAVTVRLGKIPHVKHVYVFCTSEYVYHAGSAPDVSRGSVLCSNQNLQSSVLSGLNVLCEVFVLEKREEPSDWSDGKINERKR